MNFEEKSPLPSVSYWMSAKKRKKSPSKRRKKSPSEKPKESSREARDGSSSEGTDQDLFDPFTDEGSSIDEPVEEEAPEPEPPAEEESAESEEPDPGEPEEATEEGPDEDAGKEPGESKSEEEEPAGGGLTKGTADAPQEPTPDGPAPDEPAKAAEATPRDARIEAIEKAPKPTPEKPKVVLMTETVVQPVLTDAVRTASAVMAVIGGALCLAWLIEMLLLWFPLNLQNAAWTFGTGVQTVAILPSAAVGSALVAYGLLRHPHAPTRIVRALSTVFATAGGLFAAITYSYVLSVPSTFTQAPESAVQPLRRTVVQTSLELTLAAAACFGIAVVLWRAVRKSARKTKTIEHRISM